jgi:hypothetical protein
MDQIKTVGGVKVYKDGAALLFKTGATINGDGSPHCYHKDDSKALDYLANAGGPGNWWGVATDSHGDPLVQSIEDHAPGYYVSTTALVNPSFPEHYQERYIDSERYPYIVVPGSFGSGWKVGDVAFVLNEDTGDNMYAATCDVGPTDHIGEISMLLAHCLAMNPDPKKGGAQSGIVYCVFPGSDPKYRPWRQKCPIAIDHFENWGGLSKLKQLAKEL